MVGERGASTEDQWKMDNVRQFHEPEQGMSEMLKMVAAPSRQSV